MSYTIAVPSSSILKVLNYGIPSITSVSGGVAVANGAVTITSSYPPLPTVVDSAFVQANVATGIATSSYEQANTATTLAQIVYDYANTIQGGAEIDNVARQIAFSAQANTILIQGVNNTQNTRLNSIETINGNQNTSITLLQNVNDTQNTTITAVNNFAAGAFNATNNKVSLITGTTNQITVEGTNTSPIISLSQYIKANNIMANNYIGQVNNLGLVDGNTIIDISKGNFVTANIGGPITWFFQNALPSPDVSGFVLELTNGGSDTQIWPNSINWSNGVSPNLTLEGIDILTFITFDGGTNWRGVLSIANSRPTIVPE
jgi:hypothetical protein